MKSIYFYQFMINANNGIVYNPNLELFIFCVINRRERRERGVEIIF